MRPIAVTGIRSKMRISRSLSIVTVVLYASAYCMSVQADALQQACSEIYTKFQTMSGAILHRHNGYFTDTNTCAKCRFTGTYYKLVDGGTQYYGCIMTLNGNDKKVKGNFGLDVFYAENGNKRYQEGWRSDESEDADGPDGTHFKEDKGNIVCLFDGHWDGGEDDNPSYVPSPLFEYDVACGKNIN